MHDPTMTPFVFSMCDHVKLVRMVLLRNIAYSLMFCQCRNITFMLLSILRSFVKYTANLLVYLKQCTRTQITAYSLMLNDACMIDSFRAESRRSGSMSHRSVETSVFQCLLLYFNAVEVIT